MKKTIYILVLLPSISLAHWPSFTAPNKEFLITNHYITSVGCEKGFAKFIPAEINIHGSSLCKSYCPENWVWKTQDKNQCHDLETGFNFKFYTVDHVRGNDGNTSYSKVSAHFSGFDLYLNTKPGEAWFCIDTNTPYKTIMCANDI